MFTVSYRHHLQASSVPKLLPTDENEGQGSDLRFAWTGGNFREIQTGGLSKRGLGLKGAFHWARKKGPFGAILLFPRGCRVRRHWSRSAPEKALIGAEKAPICPDFPGRISPQLSLRKFGPKSKWEISDGGLRPLSAICAQSSTIEHFCGFLGPLFKENFRYKMRTIVGNRGQLWTSTLSPHLLSPHLDFPDENLGFEPLFVSLRLD